MCRTLEYNKIMMDKAAKEFAEALIPKRRKPTIKVGLSRQVCPYICFKELWKSALIKFSEDICKIAKGLKPKGK